MLVPDQLRSAVSGTHRYDPDINPTYLEMAQHYGIAIIPARPRKPKDKSKVEVGVQIAQRWILACLRNRTFFSLDELNAANAELLERLNARRFRAKARITARHQLSKYLLRHGTGGRVLRNQRSGLFGTSGRVTSERVPGSGRNTH